VLVADVVVVITTTNGAARLTIVIYTLIVHSIIWRELNIDAVVSIELLYEVVDVP
jgi:hypothetical protein